MRSLRRLKDDALKAFERLEQVYIKEYQESRIDYLYHEMINNLLNNIKALEYHFRDDVHRGEKRPQWKKADKFLKKYGARKNSSEIYENLLLKRKHIPRNYGDGYERNSVE